MYLCLKLFIFLCTCKDLNLSCHAFFLQINFCSSVAGVNVASADVFLGYI